MVELSLVNSTNVNVSWLPPEKDGNVQITSYTVSSYPRFQTFRKFMSYIINSIICADFRIEIADSAQTKNAPDPLPCERVGSGHETIVRREG